MKQHAKKLVVLLTVLSLLCSFINVEVAFAQSNDPTEAISTVADLEKIRNNPDGNFVLTSDITMTASFTPISEFSGVLDGQGYTITGLTISASSSMTSVAFVITNTGTIKNLGFKDVAITGIDGNKNYWAAAIAATNAGTIEGCYVTGSISGGYRSGGICAHNQGMVKNCYTSAIVSAKVEAGGIAAVAEATCTIDSCYTVPNVSSIVNNTGGIAGYAYTGTVIKNCVVLAGSISNVENENIARIAGRLKGTPTFTNNMASAAALVNGASVSGGTLTNGNGLDVSNDDLQLQTTFEIEAGWDFTSAWKYDATLGRPVLRVAEEQVANTVYNITTAADLELLRTYGDNASNRFVLQNDITLTGTFTPIAQFSGTLDGNGHSIIGLTLQSDSTYPTVAFILNNDGVIENLGFSKAVAFGTQDTQNNWAAIIAGTNNGVIRRCYVAGNVSGAHRGSGIVSWNNNVVEDCYAVVTVAAKVECGGLAAILDNGSIVRNSYVVPFVYSTNNNTGGLSAYAYTGAVIKNCAVLGGVIENGGGSNIARVVGRTNSSPTFINNAASENAFVQETIISSTNADSKQGKTYDKTVMTTRALYETTLGWDFADCWMMDTELGRPILKSVDEVTNDRYVYSIISDTTATVSQGVTRRELHLMDVNGNRQAVNILEVDLDNPANSIIVGINNNATIPVDEDGNYIRIADAEDHDTIKGTLAEQMQTTRDAGVNVVAGVNGEFYTKEGPEGYMIKDGGTIVNGTRISSEGGVQYPFHGFFGITDDGVPMIGLYDTDWDSNKDDLYQATGGQFIIVEDGEVPCFAELVEGDTSDINYDEQTFYRYVTRHPRTAAGIKEDGSTVLLVTVDGRNYNNSKGVYIEELGLLMKYLGSDIAINMDGGGSTTSAYYDANTDTVNVLNVPSNSSGVAYQGKTLRSIFSTVLIVVEEE